MVRRRGFTLIEVLVTLAVILVIASIAFLAMRGVAGGQNANRTKTALATAASMLAEYDAATSLKRQPAKFWDSPKTTVTTGFDVWRDAVPPASNGNERLIPPATSVGSDERDRFESPAVLNTAVVMAEITRAGQGRTLLSQLPTGSHATVYDPTVKPGDPPVAIGPVLLDGWGNPIIFVPAAGMVVRSGEPANQYAVSSARTDPMTPSAPLPPIPTNARPFFASAGPDGLFGNGDDNLYSFQP